MNKIILIRHPQTIQNTEDIQQTFLSKQYTKRGEKELEGLKKYVKNMNISKIYSSDSPRCSYVAEEVQKLTKAQIKITNSLRDKNNGDFEGLPNSKIDWSIINKAPFEKRKAPNGESLLDVRERLKKNIYNLSLQGNILIISHTVPIRILISLYLDLPLKESILNFKINNCSLSLINYEKNRFVLEKLNEEFTKFL